MHICTQDMRNASDSDGVMNKFLRQLNSFRFHFASRENTSHLCSSDLIIILISNYN